MKQGEKEAKQILETIGRRIDDSYCDDNSRSSMPDLRFKSGRYIEVTHTKHNNSVITLRSRVLKTMPGDKIAKEFVYSTDNILEAIQRKALKHPLGDTDLFVFITQGEYNKLRQLIKTHKSNPNYSEFKNKVFKSPFKIIYLCVWSFKNQKYELRHPVVVNLKLALKNNMMNTIHVHND